MKSLIVGRGERNQNPYALLMGCTVNGMATVEHGLTVPQKVKRRMSVCTHHPSPR